MRGLFRSGLVNVPTISSPMTASSGHGSSPEGAVDHCADRPPSSGHDQAAGARRSRQLGSVWAAHSGRRAGGAHSTGGIGRRRSSALGPDRPVGGPVACSVVAHSPKSRRPLPPWTHIVGFKALYNGTARQSSCLAAHPRRIANVASHSG